MLSVGVKITPKFMVIASSGARSGLPVVSTALKASAGLTNDSEVNSPPSWFSVGARNDELIEPRRATVSLACQRRATFGSKVLPTSPP